MSGDFFQGLRHLDEGWLPGSAVLGHPLPLVLPAVATDTARHIGGISPMPEIVPAGCHQGCRQRGRLPCGARDRGPGSCTSRASWSC